MARKKEVISSYLRGARTWEDGLAIYLKHGRNETLKKIFLASGETSYNYQRLLDELQSLAPATPEAKPDQAEEGRPAESRPAESPALTIGKDDPRIFPLYRERQHLHAQLMVLPNDRQRKEAAFRIIEITRQLDELHTEGITVTEPKRDAGKQNEAVSLHNKLLNNRAYISKNRKRQDKQQQVQERIVENQQIEKILRR